MSRRLDQLNRELDRNGDTVTLRRYTGTGTPRPSNDLDLRAKIKGLVAEELVGGITQQTFVIVLSPTPIIADGWPRIDSPAPQASEIIDPASGARFPLTTDKVLVQSKERAISRVVPVFESGTCVRIELTATG